MSYSVMIKFTIVAGWIVVALMLSACSGSDEVDSRKRNTAKSVAIEASSILLNFEGRNSAETQASWRKIKDDYVSELLYGIADIQLHTVSPLLIESNPESVR